MCKWLSDLYRILKDDCKLFPVVSLVLQACEYLEFHLAAESSRSASAASLLGALLDILHIRGKLLLIFLNYISTGITDLMHDADLSLGFRENCADNLCEAI